MLPPKMDSVVHLIQKVIKTERCGYSGIIDKPTCYCCVDDTSESTDLIQTAPKCY